MKKPLSAAPLRLQRMLLQLQKYDIEVKHLSEKSIPVADTLSRHYLTDTYPELSDGLDVHVHTISSINMSDQRLKSVKDATDTDSQFCTLKRVIHDGWPDLRKYCISSVIEYWNRTVCN